MVNLIEMPEVPSLPTAQPRNEPGSANPRSPDR